MGGGSSKQTEVKAIVKTDTEKKLDAQLAERKPKAPEKEKGPASKPNIDMSPSPAISKKSGKSADIM